MKIENVEDMYPLSPMQQGMLFHTLHQGEQGMYFEQAVDVIEGRIDPVALHKAWQEIVNRHPILRTIFLWEGVDEPLQIVRKQVELPWYKKNWQEFSSEERKTKLDALLEKDRQRGFQLSQAPLMRFYLIQVDPNVHYFIWS